MGANRGIRANHARLLRICAWFCMSVASSSNASASSSAAPVGGVVSGGGQYLRLFLRTCEFGRAPNCSIKLQTDASPSEGVKAELRQASGNQHIESLICDLSRLADVRRAAEAFNTTHDRLDVLVNNAGATFKAPAMGPDGVELTFALNFGVPALLATPFGLLPPIAELLVALALLRCRPSTTSTTFSTLSATAGRCCRTPRRPPPARPRRP